MQNVTIHDLRAVATIKVIADAFGVSHPAVLAWERRGVLPEKQLYRYMMKDLPEDGKLAVSLYKKARAHRRKNGPAKHEMWRDIRDQKRLEKAQGTA